MKIATRRLWALFLLVLTVLVAGGAEEIYYAQVEAEAANAVSNLGEIAGALAAWRNSGHEPKTLHALSLAAAIDHDAVNRTKFLFFPAGTRLGACDVWVAQPGAYRTRIWPFGKRRRWAITRAGEIVDLEAVSAP